jgi:hypothetical protein
MLYSSSISSSVTPAIELDDATSTFLLAHDRIQWSAASSSGPISRLWGSSKSLSALKQRSQSELEARYRQDVYRYPREVQVLRLHPKPVLYSGYSVVSLVLLPGPRWLELVPALVLVKVYSLRFSCRLSVEQCIDSIVDSVARAPKASSRYIVRSILSPKLLESSVVLR